MTNEIEIVELGDVMLETLGAFSPQSVECSSQSVDARDA